MSDQISRKCMSSEHDLFSFAEACSIIRSGDSVKLKELILEGRIDINMVGSDLYRPQTFLTVACMSGFISCVEELLDGGADINYRDNSNSVFLSACASGSVEMVNLIITRGLNANDEILLQALNSPSMASNTEITDILLSLIQDANFSRGHRGSFYCAQVLLEM